MGLTYTSVIVRHLTDPAKLAVVQGVLVDTGSDATWIARETLERIDVTVVPGKDRTFPMADGRPITRPVGYVMFQADPNFETVDEVVFAEPGDLQLLGARTLEGFNAKVDPTNKQLVAAGPGLAAGNTRTKAEN